MDDRRPNGVGGRRGWCKSLAWGLALVGTLWLGWYVHGDRIPARYGPDLLYLPVALACWWFGWRGFALAALAGACLATSHITSDVANPTLGQDLLNSLILIAVGGVIATLKERHSRAQQDIERLRSRLDARNRGDVGEIASQPAQLSERLEDLTSNEDAEPDVVVDIDSTVDAVVERLLRLDKGMRILWANRPAYEAVGLTRQSIVGKHCYELRTDNTEPCPDCPVIAAMRAGRPQQNEKCPLDGRMWSNRGYPITDSEGNIIGGAKVALDITEASRAERERAEERNLLRTLIDNLPDAIYVKDRQSRFVLCNTEVLRRKGLPTVDAMVGKTDYDFYPHDFAAEVYHNEQTLMSTGQPIVNQERCVVDKGTGTRTWNLTTKVPLKNEQGEIIGLVGIGRDVTDRRQAEEAYRALVDHSLQGLVVIQDERVVFTNHAMSEISGYPVEEILSKCPQDLWNFIYAGDRQRVCDNHHARLNGQRLPKNYEFQIVRKDGTVRWVELHACRIEYQGRPAVHATCADVTERVRTQNALRQSEERNNALLYAIPDLIFRLSEDGVFLDYQARKSEMLFAPPEEFLGRQVAEILPDSVSQPVMRLIHKALETGQVQTLEYRRELPTGTCDWECRLVACGEHEALAIVRDITERKRAEHLSRITHDLAVKLNTVNDIRKGARLCLEAAVEASQADCGGVYLVDEAAGEMKLQTHRGMSGKFTPGVLSVGKGSAQMRLLEQGKPVYYGSDERRMPLSPMQRKAGLRAYAAIPINDDQMLIGALVVASGRCENIPRHCRAALETIAAQMGTTIARLRAEEGLIASERNYREIFNAANEATLVQDPVSGAILDVNRAGLEMFGYSYEELRQMNVGDLRAERPADNSEFIRRWFAKAVQEGPQVLEWLCERRDGRCFWVEVNLKQARIGGHDRVLAVARDITERVQAARAAENHQVELTRAWHANTLGEMASGLAHELNQPLCAIVNYAGGCLRLTGRETVDMETLRSSIEQIASQAERAAGIIRRIRSLVAKRDPRRTRLHVHDVLDETMRMMEAEIARLDITVVRDLSEDVPAIWGDAVGLQQVVLNLIRNAMEAMNGSQAGNRLLSLSTRTVKGGDEVEIAVADTGRGLSAQLTERVFDSFFTTKNKGLGIGLSLSRRIVEAHGGRLWGQSDGCSRTVFRFTLPAEGAGHEQHKTHSVCRR